MKSFLIIGASSGIGEAIANSLLSKNHQVYATYCNNEITLSHPNLKTSYFNVASSDGFSFDFPEELDGLVYCPGTINLKPFNGLKLDDFSQEFDVNVLGFIRVLKLALRSLKQRPSSVLGFSSVCAKRGFNFHSSTATSKSALEGLFVSLAKEFAPKIRFNLIAPSIIDTPLSEKLINTPKKVENISATHPIPRLGNTHDISSLANHLISEDSSWITGQVISVDGGKSNLL